MDNKEKLDALNKKIKEVSSGTITIDPDLKRKIRNQNPVDMIFRLQLQVEKLTHIVKSLVKILIEKEISKENEK